MDNKRHLTRSAIYLVLRDEDKILCIRRHNTGYRDGEYTLPAGHVEADETFLETCSREALEEVCVRLDQENLQLAHVMQRHEKGVYVTDFYFVVNEWDGTPSIGEPHKADDLQWLTLTEIESKGIHFIGKALKNIADNIVYSHDGITNEQ